MHETAPAYYHPARLGASNRERLIQNDSVNGLFLTDAGTHRLCFFAPSVYLEKQGQERTANVPLAAMIAATGADTRKRPMAAARTGRGCLVFGIWCAGHE